MTTAVEKRVTIKATTVYQRLASATKPTVVCVGGSGSSKSHSMVQLFTNKLFTSHDWVGGVTRKTFPALRMSVMMEFEKQLRLLGLYERINHHKTDHIYRYKTNLIQFFSLDDPEKVKSFNVNDLWMEEANEFSWEDFVILQRRKNLPNDTGLNTTYITLNPVDIYCWVNERLVNRATVEVIHSTYRDNPFLSESYTAEIEELRELDPNYYRIYGLGQWGQLENIIYPVWDQVDDMPTEVDWERYGVDFGYENPMVVVHAAAMDKDLYLDEVLYESHMLTPGLIEVLKDERRLDIYADSAEPDRIQTMCNAGLITYGATKNVKFGIDTVKSYRIHVTKRSVNLLKEIRSYHRKTDKDGRILDEPVKFADHLMDGVRYAVMGPKVEAPEPIQQIVIYDSMGLVDIEF